MVETGAKMPSAEFLILEVDQSEKLVCLSGVAKNDTLFSNTNFNLVRKVSGDASSVQLRVKSIVGFRHRQSQLAPEISGKIFVAGVGSDALEKGDVLVAEPIVPLNEQEYAQFSKLRLKLWGFVAAMVVIPLALVALDRVAGPVSPILLFSTIVPIFLWGLVQMFRFKCPRCKTVPMIRTVAIGEDGVDVGTMVALAPKQCRKCHVHFIPPKV